MTNYLRALAAKLRGLFGDRRADRELDDEIETHLRLLTERYVCQGMTEAEAARAARRQFGNVTLLKEDHREMHGIRFIETLVQDLQYGVRMLRKNPGFTLIAALTHCLGIGANTAIFFKVLGVQPLPPGRNFIAGEDRRGSDRVAILSHRLWQRRYNGDAEIVGKTITLDAGPKFEDANHIVVGVAPANFRYFNPFDVLVPMGLDPQLRNPNEGPALSVVARLKPGVTLEQARAELDTILQRCEMTRPEGKSRVDLRTRLVPLQDYFLGDTRRPLMVLLGAVGLILLIACANVANLLLARTVTRQKELAVRAALGADRFRLARQMLTECLLLAIAGGAAGLLLAYWLTRLRGGVIAGQIIDSQGRPVIEEKITLKKLDENNKPLSSTNYNPDDNMSRTDDRGVYRIYGLREGRYLVSVGYAPDARSVAESRRFYPRVFYPKATSESEAKAIEVSEGSEATDVDITVSDPKEARDVSGRVVDAGTGEPVEGVKIEVSGVSSDGSPRDRVRESESGPNGGFRVSGLLPGKYALLTKSRLNNGFVSDPVIFDVSESDASGIELKVRRDTASISGIVVIEGTNDPKVLAKLSQVYLYATIILAAPKTGASVEIPPVQVNADGSFRMDGLLAGKAGIWRWSQSDELTIARIERNGAPIEKRIEMAAGEQVTGVRVVFLYDALTLRGEMKVVGGTLPADCRGYVIALRADQNAGYSQSAWIDARGQFVIENLASGEYEITVSPCCPDPEIGQRFPSVKKRVFVGSDNQQPVTFVVDLSEKGGDK